MHRSTKSGDVRAVFVSVAEGIFVMWYSQYFPIFIVMHYWHAEIISFFKPGKIGLSTLLLIFAAGCTHFSLQNCVDILKNRFSFFRTRTIY